MLGAWAALGLSSGIEPRLVVVAYLLDMLPFVPDIRRVQLVRFPRHFIEPTEGLQQAGPLDRVSVRSNTVLAAAWRRDREPFERFYCGVPLVASDGHRLGTMCVGGRQPRSMEAHMVRFAANHVPIVHFRAVVQTD